MAEIPVRRAVSRLDRGSGAPAELVGYAQGIEALNEPTAKPTLEYLAAMHQAFENPSTNPDFNNCQHQGWWFLPWHRMYLRQFEKIIGRSAGRARVPQ